MKVIIAAAGTAGHINPGIAIANKIKKENVDSDIAFIGTNRGLEQDLISRAGYKLYTINAYGLSKKLTIQNLKNNINTIKSIFEAKKIIKEFKPDIVIGTGGYICGPVMLAAKKIKIPTVLHESNAFPGVAVKALSKKVDKVLVAFEDAKKRLPKAKRIVVTGNPIKMQGISLNEDKQREIKLSLGLNDCLPLVLIFGGSQGAESINNTVIELAKKNLCKKYQILCAAGQKQYDKIKENLFKFNINIEIIENIKIVPYIYNMEEIMNASDLVICRSGAMTITEISFVGKPAIFIPLPNVSQNHQERNAEVLKNVGAAEILLDKDLNYSTLSNEIEKIIFNKEKIKQMGENAKKISIKNVEDKIYEEIKKCMK